MTSISNAGAPVRAPKADTTPPAPLEPDHELPTVAPYKPSVGGWIGTAGGAIGGGLAGLAVGGVLGLAMEMSSSFGGGGGGIVMGGLALAGLVAGGLGVYHLNRSNYEDKANAKLQAEHGTSTLGFARGMMANFDHDQNGQIDLVNSTGLASRDERVFQETRQQSRSHPKYDFWEDDWDMETERWTESRGTSAAKVWEAADGAPKDGVVTDIELATLMANFDADRSGSLTTPEQEAFKQAHPVIVEEWQR